MREMGVKRESVRCDVEKEKQKDKREIREQKDKGPAPTIAS